MPEPRIITVFLGSSEELADHRTGIGDFFGQLNNIYNNRGVYLNLITWEWDDPRRQSEYEQRIRESALCFFLFFTRLGQHTLEEFETALAAYNLNGTPKVITWFRQVLDGQTADDELREFAEMLDKELGHFWNSYVTFDTLKLGIVTQIQLNDLDLPITIVDDQAMLGGISVVDLTKVPSYQGTSIIQDLKTKVARLRPEYERLKALWAQSHDDQAVLDEYGPVAAEYNDLLQQLESAQKAYLERLERHAKETMSGKALTQRQIDAYRLYEQGKVQAALEVLDPAETKASINQLRLSRQVRQAEEQARQAEEQEQARQHRNELLQYIDMLGNLPVTLDLLEEIDSLYTEADEVERDFLDDATARVSHGNFLSRLRRFNQAETCYTEALTTYRALANTNPDAHLPNLAGTLNNLGNLHSDQGHYDQAETCYTEALNTYHALANTNPDAYLPYLAATLNNLGILHWNQGHHDQAETCYTEALTIRRALANTNPDAYLPDLATTLNNLGVLHSDQGHHDQAETCYTEALTIRRKLAEANPSAYYPVLAQTMRNLADLYEQTGQGDQAKRLREEAANLET